MSVDLISVAEPMLERSQQAASEPVCRARHAAVAPIPRSPDSHAAPAAQA